MIVRTVLAVALAVALLAVSQPAIQTATREHTAREVADEVDRFVERAESLVEADDAARQSGARRIVTVTLPHDGRFSAGVDELAFEPRVLGDPRAPPMDASAISWVVEGGDTHRRVLERLRIDTPNASPVRLQEPGRHRLELSLRGSNVDPVVAVQRYERPGEVSV